MTTPVIDLRKVVGVFLLLVFAMFANPVAAQQPKSVDPTASAVKEEQLLQQFKTIQGRGSIPDIKSYTIEQPAGRDWRHFHEVTLRWIGAVAVLGMLALILVFYFTRGMVRLESGRSGRTIVRFNTAERFVHWMTASCFIVLGLSGLNVTFGKPLLLPLLGASSFSALSEWAKYAHNYLSFPFTIGVILIFFMWIAGNIPNSVDVAWFRRGGGMVKHEHPPASRFNGGQKLIYWIVVLGGGAVAISGYVLIFPFYGTTVETMQSAEMVHGIVAMLFIAVMLAHIYIGTIGMEGAFEAMGTGTVDINWAKEHHSLWLEEEAARTQSNRSQKQPSAAPGD
ncbi:MAG TPA: formate dehydrogenase subunit gamma [Candidatus Cybelea sp.]|nr:formate dehydrogenase subunit gamma [Candidatus Cybelea sp.]